MCRPELPSTEYLDMLRYILDGLQLNLFNGYFYEQHPSTTKIFDSNARKEDQEKCTFLAVAVLEKIYQTGDTSMWAKAMEILVYATSLKIEYAYTYLVKGDKFHPEKITLCELCVFW